MDGRFWGWSMETLKNLIVVIAVNSINLLKLLKLYILNELILWNANYTSIKMFFKKLKKMQVP